MEVSFEKAFSLIDGRLSTGMDDVYEMLNFVSGESLMTHQLPHAMDKIRELNPKWFSDGVNTLNKIKEKVGTNDFKALIAYIKENPPENIVLSKI